MSCIKVNKFYEAEAPHINYKQLMNDLVYKRDHPVYSDWKNWQAIALRYHSVEIMKLCQVINKGRCFRFDYHDYNEYEQYMVTDICHQKLENDYGLLNDKTFTDLFYNIDIRSSCFCLCEDEINPDCWAFEMHLKVHLISLLWSYVQYSKPRRSYRKYYHRLQRVILALGEQHLINFPLDLIINPKKHISEGRFLLTHLYEKALFDEYNQTSVVDFVERAKHFINIRNIESQLDGIATQQSGSDNSLFSSEMLIIGVQLVKRYTIDKLLDMFSPRQQGLIGVDFQHSFKDSDISRFKEIFVDTQRNFISGLADAALSTGQSLAVMFAVAGTVSLLAKGALNVSLDIVMKILHIIYSLIFGPKENERIKESFVAVEQGGVTASLPFLPAMILNYVISPDSSILKSLWKNPNIDIIMRRIGYLGDIKVERGIERVADWMKEVIYKVQSWYHIYYLGIAPTERLDQGSAEIEIWYKEVEKILKEYHEGTYIWSDSNWSVLHNLYSTGLSLSRREYLKKYKFDIWKMINPIANLLEKYKQHKIDNQSVRNPPVTIYLSGGSGVGKSTLTYALTTGIIHTIFTEEKNDMDLEKNWPSLVYSRAGEQVYWDGYEGQLVTVFDDFNQQIDSASNPSVELFEIIRASNCFPYPLHMAALDQKACTNFSSKIILASSNMQKPKTQSLNFPDALYRRFDVCIRVERKEEYKNYRASEFNPDIYVLTEYDMVTGEDLRTISYDDLVGLCAIKYFSGRSFVGSLKGYIKNAVRQPARVPIQQGGLDHMMSLAKVREAMPCIHPCNFQPKYYSLNPITSIINGCKYIKDYFYPLDDWSELTLAVNSFKSKMGEIQIWWTNFREKHSYMVKAVVIIGMIMTGVMFVKTFNSIRKVFDKAPESKLMDAAAFAKQWNGHRTSRVCGESYNPLTIKTPKAEAYTPSSIKTAKVESYNPSTIKISKVESLLFDPKTGLPEAQGIKDMNATEILMSVARRNLYKIYESTTNAPLGHVLFLKGKIAIMPRHFLYGMQQSLRNDKEATIYFKSVLLERGFECHISDLLDSRKDYQSPPEDVEEAPVTRDLTVITVATSIVHPDVTPFFSTKSSLSYVDVTEVVLPVMVTNNVKGSQRDILMLRFRKGKSALKRIVEPLPVGNETSHIVRYVRDAWRYECDTQPTECGSPVIVRNSQISPGKICGIHIAGIEGTGEGFATPVYQEDIIAILSQFPLQMTLSQRQRENLNEFPTQQGQVPDSAEFIRLGTIKESLYQPTKTKIEPSLCHNTYRTPISKPCQLRPNKDFDPRTYRLERLGNIPHALPRDVIQNSKQALIDEISSVVAANSEMVNQDIKAVYSFEEAVKGIPGEIYVNSIKRTTSPGYPFIKNHKLSTRKKIFGEADEYDLESEECKDIHRRVSDIVAAAKRGEVLDHYFVDTLKDERKPIHKAHKTRLFSAGPIDYLIACKMYFNGPVALLQKTRNWSHISVGSNPYSNDWNEIAQSLLRKSKCMVAGDFEGFDASQHQLLLEASGEIFIQISKRFLNLTEQDELVMRVLLVSLFNSMHITGNEVYQWTHSLASGHYLTAPINSVFVNIAFGCIWQLAFDQVSYVSARSFWNECGIVAYGDDHIVSIPKNRLDIFNQYTIPTLFSMIGLSYTMEDKDASVTQPWRPLEQISYLKRAFRKDETNRWIAPLSLDVVLETPQWVHKTPDKQTQTIENLEWALKELSLHPKETWDQWSSKLKKEQEKLGYYTFMRYQEDARDKCLSQEFNM